MSIGTPVISIFTVISHSSPFTCAAAGRATTTVETKKARRDTAANMKGSMWNDRVTPGGAARGF
jgi:hypothetical protein